MRFPNFSEVPTMTVPSGKCLPQNLNRIRARSSQRESESLHPPAKKSAFGQTISWCNFSHFCAIFMRASYWESTLARGRDGRAQEEGAACPEGPEVREVLPSPFAPFPTPPAPTIAAFTLPSLTGPLLMPRPVNP